MKILIAEDDVVSRKLILKVLSDFGDCDFVINGLEAIDAYLLGQKVEKISESEIKQLVILVISDFKMFKVLSSKEKNSFSKKLIVESKS